MMIFNFVDECGCSTYDGMLALAGLIICLGLAVVIIGLREIIKRIHDSN